MESDADVLGLILVGSAAQAAGRLDEWSDLDIILVVRDAAFSRYYPSTYWLKGIGELWAWEQPQGGRATTLARFADLRRLDVVAVPESALGEIEEWGAHLLAAGFRVLFSRSAQLDALLTREFHPPPVRTASAGEWERTASRYWFACGLAVYKVVRGDLLVALHLTLELEQECLVLAMMLRDRTTGTTQHRDSVVYREVLECLPSVHDPGDPASILDRVEGCSLLFDELSVQWCGPGYDAHRGPLLEYIQRARGVLAGEQA
ncbi:MAG: aminoglycoside 6-adenylyltransferase [Chloroflexota bacterium]|nr:aminoglycoside 6-adenylyltransferase [Chloroflexota bacterium]